MLDIENYRSESLLPRERLALFLMATYGDGEPTDNAADFYSWICTEVEDVENGVKDPTLEVRAWRAHGADVLPAARRAHCWYMCTLP